MHLHKCNEPESISKDANAWDQRYTFSQIQYIPETIRRYVENCVDCKAIALLGGPIANTIDLYRLVRVTCENCKEEDLSQIAWMLCFGMKEEDYVPLENFSGYYPEHERNNIDGIYLLWAPEDDDA